MLARLPAKHRNNIFVYFTSRPGESAGGEEDITVSNRWEDPQMANKLKRMVSENDRLKSLLEKQKSEISLLQTELSKNKEHISSIERLGIATAKTSQIDDRVGNLQAEIILTKSALRNSEENYEKCSVNLINARNDLANLTIRTKSIVPTPLPNENSPSAKLSRTLSAISSQIKKTGEDSAQETAQQVLLDMKKQLQNAVSQQATAVAERQSLVADLEKLRAQLTLSQQEKGKILRLEKQNLDSVSNDLATVRKELSIMREEYEKERIRSGASSKEMTEMRDQLFLSEEKYRLIDKTCKDQLMILSREAQIRADRLDSENKQLADKMKKNEKDREITAVVVEKSEKEIFETCERNRIEINEMIKVIFRQVQIYEISNGTVSNDPAFIAFNNNNKAVYETGRSILNKFNDNISCVDLLHLHAQTVEVFNRIKSLQSMLINIYEDSVGAVRVYVRLRPTDSSNKRMVVTKQGKSIVYHGNVCSVPLPIKTYGRFFGVIPDTFKNPDVYTGCSGTTVDKDLQIVGHGVKKEIGETCCISNDATGLCRVMNQIRDGYHLILFGYGYSGSGKTLTLLGDSRTGEPGLAQLAVANTGAKSVNLKAIFELTYDKIDFRMKNFNSGHFVELFSRGSKSEKVLKNIPDTMIKNEQSEFDKIIGTVFSQSNPFKTRPITGKELYELRKVLDLHRVNKGRIKATPNNPQSSRSHLFITLEFIYANNTKGYLTVVDMGGRESSIDVLEMFLEKPEKEKWQLTSMLMNDATLIPKYITGHNFTVTDPSLSWIYDEKRYSSEPAYTQEVNLYVKRLNSISHDMDKVIQVLKESVFINETINQLTLFFKVRQDPNGLHNVKELRFPLDEKKNPYDPLHFLAGRPTANDKMGMYRILTNLSTLYNKPSKFVMICNIRQESTPSNFCRATRDSLEFAHGIRST